MGKVRREKSSLVWLHLKLQNGKSLGLKTSISIADVFIAENCMGGFKYCNVFSLLVIMCFAFSSCCPCSFLSGCFVFQFCAKYVTLLEILPCFCPQFFPVCGYCECFHAATLSTTPSHTMKGANTPELSSWGLKVLPQRHLKSITVTSKLNLHSIVFPLESIYYVFNSACNTGLYH